MPFYFISYSRIDGEDFALELSEQLTAGPPSIGVWLDRRQLQPGIDWDEQLVEALRSCEGCLYVMTRDSVRSNSECKKEWTRALKYKKPVIPLLFHAGAELPYRLDPRQYIDFTDGFDAGLAGLRGHVRWRGTPAGVLHGLKERLADAHRDLDRAGSAGDRRRIEKDIAELERQIGEQQQAIENPQAAQRRTEENVQAGLERERQPAQPVSGVTRIRFINQLPMIPPLYFQNRHVETGLIGTFLKDESLRLMIVIGRGGVGKTAMVCRLLRSVESGKLPDDGGALAVDGIVYLSAQAGHPVSFPNLFGDLCKLLSEVAVKHLDQLYRDTLQSTAAKMQALLTAFPSGGRTIVLLDNFENIVDPETHAIKNPELDEALCTALEGPPHGIKFLLTTRVAPQALLQTEPALQQTLPLDEGLASPYAEEVLKAMDADGSLGLRAPEAPLSAARQATRGYPRALEAIVGILRSDRSTTLPDVLLELRQLQPGAGNVVRVLVGEAFNRLDPTAQEVMQALAIYGAPVPAVAVDYLLQPYRTGVDSPPVLRRLVNMQFVRSEARRFYLHQVDRDYALSHIPEGELHDRATEPLPFTRYALRHRAAEYFKETRKPRETWKTLDDLAPQLAEFEVRTAGEEYDAAASVLLEISNGDYLPLWGHARLCAELHERLKGHLTDRELMESSCSSLGLCYSSLGDYPRAIDYHQQALAIARDIGNRYGEGFALGSLGSCYSRLGDYPRAIDHHQQALAIARDIGYRNGEGFALGSLGLCYFSLGDYPRAIDHHQQALAIARDIGNRNGEGFALGSLGSCYFSLGDYPRAIDHHQQALAIARDIGDRNGESLALTFLGLCYFSLGDYPRAIDHHQQALAIARDIGNRYGESLALAYLGLCYSSLGDYPRAIDHHQQALAIARDIGDRNGESLALTYLGCVSSDTGNLPQSCRYFQEASKIGDTGNRHLQHAVRFGLALTHLYADDLEAAGKAIDGAREYDCPENTAATAATWTATGIIRLRQGEPVAANKAFACGLAEADRLLERCGQNVSALDTKGLVLCGLALCEDKSHLTAAEQAFGAARKITQAKGVVARVLNQFDALARADMDGILSSARKAAEGE